MALDPRSIDIFVEVVPWPDCDVHIPWIKAFSWPEVFELFSNAMERLNDTKAKAKAKANAITNIILKEIKRMLPNHFTIVQPPNLG